MEIGLREVIEAAVAVFMLGGVWRDVRSTMKTVASLKHAYTKDRQVIVRLVEQHNMNHDAQIQLPDANGNGG
jgi:hypothetical protein